MVAEVPGNHSAHKSKETRAWLQAHPGRFELVFTPTHGSWLNMIEGFFAKMTHQMLKGIRVESKAELARRIYLWFGEVNKVPVFASTPASVALVPAFSVSLSDVCGDSSSIVTCPDSS